MKSTSSITIKGGVRPSSIHTRAVLTFGAGLDRPARVTALVLRNFLHSLLRLPLRAPRMVQSTYSSVELQNSRKQICACFLSLRAVVRGHFVL